MYLLMKMFMVSLMHYETHAFPIHLISNIRSSIFNKNVVSSDIYIIQQNSRRAIPLLRNCADIRFVPI